MEWIKLLSIALELMGLIGPNQNIEIKTRWENLNNFSLLPAYCDSALVIDFGLKENHRLLKSFVVVPWQQLNYDDNENNMSVALSLSVYTVTDYALVFELTGTENETDMPEQIDYLDSFNTLIDYEKNNTQVKNQRTIIDGYQLLKFEEYLNYVILNIAEPGSRPVQINTFDSIFGNKMIKLGIIPDFGKIKHQWYCSGLNDEKKAKRSDLIAIFEKALENCLMDTGLQNRTEVYQQALDSIDNLSEPENKAYFKNLLRNWLFIDEQENISLYNNDIYGDYHPKLTPDVVTDFRPGIREIVDSLPPAAIENLPELCKLFINYKNKATKNKGKWVDGNMILGAKQKEYIPGNEELILGEIGKRIDIISKSNNAGILAKVLDKAHIKDREYKYLSFTFTHADVMGSGRFFYVDEISENCVQIK